MYVFGVGQHGKQVQQDAGLGHEGGGQRFWNIIPRLYTNFQLRTLGTFWTFSHVVQAHAAAGIKKQPCKTKLFQSEEEYLGHKISKGGVLMMIPE